jgi:hypothetical protein
MTYRDSIASSPLCVTCGVALASGDQACGFCGGDPRVAPQTAPPGRSLPAAMDLWGRSIWGAPRRLSRLVSRVEIQDDLVERFYTETVRRDVGWELAPGRGQPGAPPMQPADVDPFAISPSQLRANSEHTIVCQPCVGSGAVACGACHGSGRLACHECRGSGQILRQYRKSSRWINCPSCRGKQTLACGYCNRTGRVVCAGCGGSKRQSAWLIYTEAVHHSLRIHPAESVHANDPYLNQRRPLAPADLARFAVLVDRTSREPGGLGRTEDIDTPFARAARPRLEPRREIVRLQQYQRLVVVRRQVTYEMAGTQGSIAFTGADGLALPLRGARAPIERRRWLWAALTGGLCIGAVVLHSHAVGKSAYFVGPSALLSWVLLAAILLSSVAVGAVLREWRPGFRFGKLLRPELVTGGLGVLLVNVATALAIFSQPRLSQVTTALAAGDLDRAKLVVEAMEEVGPGQLDTTTAQDVYAMAAVGKAPLRERLKLLDGVAARGQVEAATAAKRARAERIGELNRLLAKGEASAANTALVGWFPSWEGDAELRPIRAKASDLERTSCGDDPLCTMIAARNAARAEPTPERTNAEASARRAVQTTLTPGEILGEPGTSRLKRLKAAAALAERVPKVAPDELALVQMATTTAASVGAERGKVALLGSDVLTATEIVGMPTARGAGIPAVPLEGGGNLYLAVDPSGICRGVYATGDASSRALKSAYWTPNKILSQALGRAAYVQQASDSHGTARWLDGGVPVVVRWRAGEVVEMRIGAAAP